MNWKAKVIETLGGYPSIEAALLAIRSEKRETEIIKALGGYPTINSAIDAIEDKDPAAKNRILTLAVKKLFNTIGPEDILRTNQSGEWFFQGKVLPSEVKTLMIAEASAFRETRFWKVVQADIKWQTNRRMFLQGRTEIDLIAGKLWLFTLEAIQTRMSSMIIGSGLFNSKSRKNH